MKAERRVYITQCLCSQRHCIMATAGEADASTAEATIKAPLVERVAELLATRALNPWCAICGSSAGDWRYELARTPYRTMEAAMPEIKRLENEQQLTNALWGDTHRTGRPT